MDILALFQEGGFIMWPLLICSLAVWAVGLEKLWVLHQFKKEFKRLNVEAVALIKSKKVPEARGLFSGASPMVAMPHLALFENENSEHKLGTKNDRVRRRMGETAQQLKRHMWIIGTVASASPFIGLLGTVVGIIRSFDSIAKAGKSGFAVVAHDLSEALVATAAGILVAVIAVMFYNFLQTRINLVYQEFKNGLEDLNDYL